MTALALRSHRPLRGHHRSLERHRTGDRARARRPPAPTSSASRSTTARPRRRRSPIGEAARPTSSATPSVPADLERAAAAAIETYGRLDIWVNNAARPLVKPFLETTEEDWRDLLDVNLFGYVWGCRVAARHMVAAGGGRIINVSSAADVQPLADLSAYITAKGGIVGLTKTLAVELAPHGITRQRPRARSDRHAAQRDVVHAGGAGGVREADLARVHRRPLGHRRRRRVPRLRCLALRDGTRAARRRGPDDQRLRRPRANLSDRMIPAAKLANADQVATAVISTVADGAAAGSRAVDVRVWDGIDLRLLPDRGLDVGAAWFRGIPLAWISPAGRAAAAAPRGARRQRLAGCLGRRARDDVRPVERRRRVRGVRPARDVHRARRRPTCRSSARPRR